MDVCIEFFESAPMAGDGVVAQQADPDAFAPDGFMKLGGCVRPAQVDRYDESSNGMAFRELRRQLIKEIFPPRHEDQVHTGGGDLFRELATETP